MACVPHFVNSRDGRNGRIGQGVRSAAGQPRHGRGAGQPDAGKAGRRRRGDHGRPPRPPRQMRPRRLHGPGHRDRVRTLEPRAARARGGRAGQQRGPVVSASRVLPKGRGGPVRRQQSVSRRMGTAAVRRHGQVQHHVHGKHVPDRHARHGRTETWLCHQHWQHCVRDPVSTVDHVWRHEGTMQQYC